MITKAHFHNFRVSEVLQFLYDIMNACEEHDPEKLLIRLQITSLQEANDNLDTVYKVAQGSMLTEDVVKNDRFRDKGITGIKLCAESFTYHYNPTIVSAAKYILNSIEIHGKSIPTLNLESETSTLNDILNSWKDDPKLAAALVTLNLVDWAAELKRLNDLFTAVFRSREKESSQRPEESTIDMRKIAIEAYRELTSTIEAHDKLSKDGSYKPLISQINSFVHKYNTLADSHGDDDKGTTPPKVS